MPITLFACAASEWKVTAAAVAVDAAVLSAFGSLGIADLGIWKANAVSAPRRRRAAIFIMMFWRRDGERAQGNTVSKHALERQQEMATELRAELA